MTETNFDCIIFTGTAFLTFVISNQQNMFGNFLSWMINFWLNVTGKSISLDQHPWLRGPVSEGKVIGEDFYARFAQQEGLKLEVSAAGGLIPDFSTVTVNSTIPASQLHHAVRYFYEQTARYKMDVWGKWFPPFAFFAKTLISAVSRKMNQLNIPLDALETSMGMSSEVIQLKDAQTGEVKYTCWLRKTLQANKVVYAGFYTHCKTPEGTFVKVVFPLPKGNVTVVLKAEVQKDGGVLLISAGNRIGDAGYYRILSIDRDKVKVRRIPIKETIHVYVDKEGILRTDHKFRFWGMQLLHLHYKINKTA